MWKYTEGPLSEEPFWGRRIESTGSRHWHTTDLVQWFVIFEDTNAHQFRITTLKPSLVAGPFDSIEPALVWLKLKGVQE